MLFDRFLIPSFARVALGSLAPAPVQNPGLPSSLQHIYYHGQLRPVLPTLDLKPPQYLTFDATCGKKSHKEGFLNHADCLRQKGHLLSQYNTSLFYS